jgi:uncharacterized membrane protein
MPQIKESITINRPISETFRYATNFNTSPEWQPDVQSVHQSEDKPRAGVMVTQNRKTYMMGTKLDLNADIIDYNLNHFMEYKGVLGKFPARGRLSFESGGGVTTVTETIDIRMGFFYAVFSPFMSRTMSRRTRTALEGLKQRLESRSTATVTSYQDDLS